MISPEFATLFTAMLYACAILAGATGILLRNKLLKAAGPILSGGGFAFQSILLLLGFHRLYPHGLSFGAYMQIFAWFTMLCGLILSLKTRQKGILLFATTFCLMLFLISTPLLWAQVRLPDELKFSFYAFHIGCLFLGLALLAIAFIDASIFILLDRKIKKRHSVHFFWKDMPALDLLDKINSICVLCAFPLYTVGILTGLLWSMPIYGIDQIHDPKNILSVAIWLFFSILFYNRLCNGWIGKKPAKLTIFVFILCLLSIILVNMMSISHHSFIRG